MSFFKCITKPKAALIWILSLCSLSGLFIFSQECKEGATDGILLCLGVLVPSLFPFMVISCFIAKTTNFGSGNALDKITKKLFGMRGTCITPVIMALIGGYPVGAVTISAMYKNKALSKTESEKLSYICCSAGPGFLYTYIGISVLSSKKAGIILLLSQIISMLSLCFIVKITYKKENISEASLIKFNSNVSLSEALVSSVRSAVKPSAFMCGFVIISSIACKIIIKGFNLKNDICLYIIPAIEITNGINFSAKYISLPILSAFCSFGGLCVHLQIFSELKGIEFTKIKFFIFRITQSILSFIITKVLITLFPITASVFSSVDSTPNITFYSNITGCFALITACVVFILSLSSKRKI